MLTYQLSKITSASFYYMDIKTSVTEDQNVKKKYYFLFEGFPLSSRRYSIFVIEIDAGISLINRLNRFNAECNEI